MEVTMPFPKNRLLSGIIIPPITWKQVSPKLIRSVALAEEKELPDTIKDLGLSILDLGIFEIGCCDNTNIHRKIQTEASHIYNYIRKRPSLLKEAEEVDSDNLSVYFSKDDFKVVFNTLKTREVGDVTNLERKVEYESDEEDDEYTKISNELQDKEWRDSDDPEVKAEIVALKKRQKELKANLQKKQDEVVDTGEAKKKYVDLMLNIASGTMENQIKALQEVMQILATADLSSDTYIALSRHIPPPDPDIPDSKEEYEKDILAGREALKDVTDKNDRLINYWDKISDVGVLVFTNGYYPNAADMAKIMRSNVNILLDAFNNRQVVKGNRVRAPIVEFLQKILVINQSKQIFPGVTTLPELMIVILDFLVKNAGNAADVWYSNKEMPTHNFIFNVPAHAAEQARGIEMEYEDKYQCDISVEADNKILVTGQFYKSALDCANELKRVIMPEEGDLGEVGEGEQVAEGIEYYEIPKLFDLSSDIDIKDFLRWFSVSDESDRDISDWISMPSYKTLRDFFDMFRTQIKKKNYKTRLIGNEPGDIGTRVSELIDFIDVASDMASQVLSELMLCDELSHDFGNIQADPSDEVKRIITKTRAFVPTLEKEKLMQNVRANLEYPPGSGNVIKFRYDWKTALDIKTKTRFPTLYMWEVVYLDSNEVEHKDVVVTAPAETGDVDRYAQTVAFRRLADCVRIIECTQLDTEVDPINYIFDQVRRQIKWRPMDSRTKSSHYVWGLFRAIPKAKKDIDTTPIPIGVDKDEYESFSKLFSSVEEVFEAPRKTTADIVSEILGNIQGSMPEVYNTLVKSTNIHDRLAAGQFDDLDIDQSISELNDLKDTLGSLADESNTDKINDVIDLIDQNIEQLRIPEAVEKPEVAEGIIREEAVRKPNINEFVLVPYVVNGVASYNDFYTANEVIKDYSGQFGRRGEKLAVSIVDRIPPVKSQFEAPSVTDDMGNPVSYWYPLRDLKGRGHSGDYLVLKSMLNEFSLFELDNLTTGMNLKDRKDDKGKNIPARPNKYVKPSVGDLDPDNFGTRDPETGKVSMNSAQTQKWLKAKLAGTGWDFDKLSHALWSRLLNMSRSVYYNRIQRMNKKTVGEDDFFQQAQLLMVNALMRDKKRDYVDVESGITVVQDPTDKSNLGDLRDEIMKGKNRRLFFDYAKKQTELARQEGTIGPDEVLDNDKLISGILERCSKDIRGGGLVALLMSNIYRDLGKYARKSIEEVRYTAPRFPGGINKADPHTTPITGWEIVVKMMYNPQNGILYKLNNDLTRAIPVKRRDIIVYSDKVTGLDFASKDVVTIWDDLKGPKKDENKAAKWKAHVETVFDAAKAGLAGGDVDSNLRSIHDSIPDVVGADKKVRFAERIIEFLSSDEQNSEEWDNLEEMLMLAMISRLENNTGLDILHKLVSQGDIRDFAERRLNVVQHDEAGRSGIEKVDRFNVAKKWVLGALDAYAKTFMRDDKSNYGSYKDIATEQPKIVVSGKEMDIKQIIDSSIWTLEKRPGRRVDQYMNQGSDDEEQFIPVDAAMTPRHSIPPSDEIAQTRELVDLAIKKGKLTDEEYQVLNALLKLKDPQAAFGAYKALQAFQVVKDYYHDNKNNIDIPMSYLDGTEDEIRAKLSSLVKNTGKYGESWYSPTLKTFVYTNDPNKLFDFLTGPDFVNYIDEYRKRVRKSDKVNGTNTYAAIFGSDENWLDEDLFKQHLQSKIIPELMQGYVWYPENNAFFPEAGLPALFYNGDTVDSVIDALSGRAKGGYGWMGARKESSKGIGGSVEYPVETQKALQFFRESPNAKEWLKGRGEPNINNLARYILLTSEQKTRSANEADKITDDIIQRLKARNDKDKQQLEKRSELVTADPSEIPFTAEYVSVIDDKKHLVEIPQGIGSTEREAVRPSYTEVRDVIIKNYPYTELMKNIDMSDDDKEDLIKRDISRILNALVIPFYDSAVRKTAEKPFFCRSWETCDENTVFGGQVFRNGIYLPASTDSTDEDPKPPTPDQVERELCQQYSEYLDLAQQEKNPKDPNMSRGEWDKLRKTIFDKDVASIISNVMLVPHFDVDQVGKVTPEKVQDLIGGLNSKNTLQRSKDGKLELGSAVMDFISIGPDVIVVDTLREYLETELRKFKQRAEQKKNSTRDSVTKNNIVSLLDYYDIDKSISNRQERRLADEPFLPSQAQSSDYQKQIASATRIGSDEPLPPEEKKLSPEEEREEFGPTSESVFHSLGGLMLEDEEDIDVEDEELPPPPPELLSAQKRIETQKGLGYSQRNEQILNDINMMMKLQLFPNKDECSRFVWSFNIWQALESKHKKNHAYLAYDLDWEDATLAINVENRKKNKPLKDADEVRSIFLGTMPKLRAVFRNNSFGFGDINPDKDTFVDWFKSQYERVKNEHDAIALKDRNLHAVIKQIENVISNVPTAAKFYKVDQNKVGLIIKKISTTTGHGIPISDVSNFKLPFDWIAEWFEEMAPEQSYGTKLTGVDWVDKLAELSWKYHHDPSGLTLNELNQIKLGLEKFVPASEKKMQKASEILEASKLEIKNATTPAGVITCMVVKRLGELGVETRSERLYQVGKVLHGNQVYAITVSIVPSATPYVVVSDAATAEKNKFELYKSLPKDDQEKYINHYVEELLPVVKARQFSSLESDDIEFILNHIDRFGLSFGDRTMLKAELRLKQQDIESLEKEKELEGTPVKGPEVQSEGIHSYEFIFEYDRGVSIKDLIIDDIVGLPLLNEAFNVGPIKSEDQIDADKIVHVAIPASYFRSTKDLSNEVIQSLGDTTVDRIVSLIKMQPEEEGRLLQRVGLRESGIFKEPVGMYSSEEIQKAIAALNRIDDAGNVFFRSGNTMFNGPLLYNKLYSVLKDQLNFTSGNVRGQLAKAIISKSFKAQYVDKSAQKDKIGSQNADIVQQFTAQADAVAGKEDAADKLNSYRIKLYGTILNALRSYVTNAWESHLVSVPKGEESGEMLDWQLRECGINIEYINTLSYNLDNLIKSDDTAEVITTSLDGISKYFKLPFKKFGGDPNKIKGKNAIEIDKAISRTIINRTVVNPMYKKEDSQGVAIGSETFNVLVRPLDIDSVDIKFGNANFNWTKPTILYYGGIDVDTMREVRPVIQHKKCPTLDWDSIDDATKEIAKSSPMKLINFLNDHYGLVDSDTIYISIPRKYYETRKEPARIKAMLNELYKAVYKGIPEDLVDEKRAFKGRQIDVVKVKIGDGVDYELGIPDLFEPGNMSQKFADYFNEQYTNYMNLAKEADRFRIRGIEIPRRIDYNRMRKNYIESKKQEFVKKFLDRVEKNYIKYSTAIKKKEMFISELEKKISEGEKSLEKRLSNEELQLRKLYTEQGQALYGGDAETSLVEAERMANHIFKLLIKFGHPAVVSDPGTDYLNDGGKYDYQKWWNDYKDDIGNLDPNRPFEEADDPTKVRVRKTTDPWADYFNEHVFAGVPKDAGCVMLDKLMGDKHTTYTKQDWDEFINAVENGRDPETNGRLTPEQQDVMYKVYDMFSNFYKNLGKETEISEGDRLKLREWLLDHFMFNRKAFFTGMVKGLNLLTLDDVASFQYKDEADIYGDVEEKEEEEKPEAEKEQGEIASNIMQGEPELPEEPEKAALVSKDPAEQARIEQIMKVINLYLDENEEQWLVAMQQKFVNGSAEERKLFIEKLNDALVSNDGQPLMVDTEKETEAPSVPSMGLAPAMPNRNLEDRMIKIINNYITDKGTKDMVFKNMESKWKNKDPEERTGFIRWLAKIIRDTLAKNKKKELSTSMLPKDKEGNVIEQPEVDISTLFNQFYEKPTKAANEDVYPTNAYMYKFINENVLSIPVLRAVDKYYKNYDRKHMISAYSTVLNYVVESRTGTWFQRKMRSLDALESIAY